MGERIWSGTNLEWNKTGVEQNRSGDFNPLENERDVKGIKIPTPA